MVSINEEQDFSPGLRALIDLDPAEQADFWKSCVSCKQGELDAIRGLTLDSVNKDVLTRYFDPTPKSINKVFTIAAGLQKDQNTKDVLQKDGLYIALSDFYAVFDVVTSAEEKQEMMTGSNKDFERVCETVSIPCNKDCFGYALRRLRIAILLRHFDLEGGQSTSCRDAEDFWQGQIYDVDYDTEDIWTPFNYCHKTGTSLKTFALPVAEPHVSHACFSEYFFKPKRNQGNVHWTHVDHPNMELILAMGQVWRLPAPQLALMFNLEKTHSQISVPDKEALSRDHGYAWSFMTLPTIYLDKYSRESLKCYRNWYEKRRDVQKRHLTSAKPPQIRVAATYANLAMMWTSETASSLVTVSTDFHYIGKWNTDTEKHSRTFFQSVMAMITCEGRGFCCTRRKKGDEDILDPAEGEPLLHDEESMKPLKSMKCEKLQRSTSKMISQHWQMPRHDVSAELQKLLDDDTEEETMFGERATDTEKSTIKFEDRFHKLLTSLQQSNSVMRLGNHYDLLLRICADRTYEYLEVLETYEAAVVRMTYLLNDHKTNNKDTLIAKTEQIKMELSKLQMFVDPFANCVVTELAEHMETMTGQHRAHPQMRDIQNNILAFQPKCQSIVDSCTDLTVQYDRATGNKMNDILNILTFITFVITPMQLMTGIYGMNWDHMPELHWKMGYHYFWSLSIVLSIVFALILVCLQRTE